MNKKENKNIEKNPIKQLKSERKGEDNKKEECYGDQITPIKSIHNSKEDKKENEDNKKNLLLISGCLNGDIVACEYFNKQFLVNKIFGHDYGINAIDFLDEYNFITCGNDNTIKMWNYSNDNGQVEIKQILELKDENSNMIIYDLSCKDNSHFACCGETDGEGVVNYWMLNDEKKWESKELYRQIQENSKQ